MHLIKEEAQRLKGNASKVFIGGFSQGGMVSLATLMRYKGKQPLGGAISLSGIHSLPEKPMEETEKNERENLIRKTPLFLYMGKRDDFFKIPVTETSYEPIKKIYTGPDGKLHKNYLYNTERNLKHAISKNETTLLKRWIQDRMTS